MLAIPPVVASVTELRVTAGGVTSSEKAALVTPATSAVRLAEPKATPPARPEEPRLTTPALLVFQLETELP
jgi:hypothetical protein